MAGPSDSSSRSSASSAVPGGTPVEVELHLATLDLRDAELERLQETLDDAERARADARQPERERRRFVADHGWRRELLGRLIGCAPSEIAYASAPNEAPRLTGDAVPWFSASRAGGLALYAVSATAPVGVDIEPVPGGGEDPRLPERVLSPTERAAWERLPSAARPASLMACWTRKEAHGKALGTGLVFPLTEVTVWAGDDRPVRCGDVLVQAVDLAAGIDPDAPDPGPAADSTDPANPAGCVAAIAVRVPEITPLRIDRAPRELRFD